MATIPKVFISIPSEGNIASAELVTGELLNKFGISDVTIRSSRAPVDRFLTTYSGEATAVWVFYTGSSLATANLLQEESPFPVLEVDAQGEPKDIAWTIAKWCSLGCLEVAKKIRQTTVEMRQAKLVDDAQMQTKSLKYHHAIAGSYDQNTQITGDNIGLEGKRGKVRDRFDVNDKCLALVTTDRQSGFDRQLAVIPFKGAVLNLTSAFWFEKTRHIIPNHLLDIPHPNVSLVKKCNPFPIEFVVRSYMTGSTSTSIWKNYQDGVRTYCGHKLPDGMKKNQKLVENLLTPTTKEEEHDRPISAEDIVNEKWMTQEDLDVCGQAALKIFALGQEIASEHGLILVDTKYEFGRDAETGEIMLIDEVHTPDSSRYWLASSYAERIAEGLEPENIDKEFLRLWFRDQQCDPYKDAVLPEAPRDLVLELSRRYITLYEMITWKEFDFTNGGGEETIASAIQSHQ